MVLAATSAFRCPGPEPKAAPADDGTGGDGGASASTTTTSSGGADPGSGGDSAVGTSADTTTTTTSSGEAGGGVDVVGSTGSGGCGPTDADVANCGGCGRDCDLTGVLNARCEDGLCTSTCVTGRVNVGKPSAPDDDDGCELEGQRVFVTSTPMPHAGFGGVSGADALCQGHADDAALDGVWKAWASETGVPAVCPAVDFPHATVPYRLVGGTVVADDWDDLTDGSLDHAIDQDELGDTDVDVSVWTGTLENGFDATGNCGNWTNQFTDQAQIGRSAASDGQWTNFNVAFCMDSTIHLYCFEQ